MQGKKLLVFMFCLLGLNGILAGFNGILLGLDGILLVLSGFYWDVRTFSQVFDFLDAGEFWDVRGDFDWDVRGKFCWDARGILLGFYWDM